MNVGGRCKERGRMRSVEVETMAGWVLLGLESPSMILVLSSYITRRSA